GRERVRILDALEQLAEAEGPRPTGATAQRSVMQHAHHLVREPRIERTRRSRVFAGSGGHLQADRRRTEDLVVVREREARLYQREGTTAEIGPRRMTRR